jgi:hypothetical protein
MRLSLVVIALSSAIFAAVCAIAPSASADDDDYWFPTEQEVRALGRHDALAVLRELLGSSQINLCGFVGDHTARAQELVIVTGNAVTLRCSGLAQPVAMPFASRAMKGFEGGPRRETLHYCETRDGTAYYGRPLREEDLSCFTSAGSRYGRYDRETLRRFITAWTYLSQAAAVRPPDEAALRISLANLPPITPDIEESLRRTQIQAELAIRENRLDDASRLYQAALTDHPGWAFGHYNHALLLGQLEFYPIAIWRMRIYLYLTPGAPDGRAVQDRIYEWEARLPRAPPR